MKPDEQQLVLLRIEDKKNANAFSVAGRYASVTEGHSKCRPLSEEERRLVVEKLGSGKLVKFLSNA